MSSFLHCFFVPLHCPTNGNGWSEGKLSRNYDTEFIPQHVCVFCYTSQHCMHLGWGHFTLGDGDAEVVKSSVHPLCPFPLPHVQVVQDRRAQALAQCLLGTPSGSCMTPRPCRNQESFHRPRPMIYPQCW